jgi:hypothetical protein
MTFRILTRRDNKSTATYTSKLSFYCFVFCMVRSFYYITRKFILSGFEAKHPSHLQCWKRLGKRGFFLKTHGEDGILDGRMPTFKPYIVMRNKIDFISLLSLFWKKNRVGLWDHVAVCVCINPINFRTPEPIFMKLGTYITAPEPNSTAQLKNLFHQSLCLYVYPLSLLGNGSVETLPR